MHKLFTRTLFTRNFFTRILLTISALLAVIFSFSFVSANFPLVSSGTTSDGKTWTQTSLGRIVIQSGSTTLYALHQQTARGVTAGFDFSPNPQYPGTFISPYGTLTELKNCNIWMLNDSDPIDQMSRNNGAFGGSMLSVNDLSDQDSISSAYFYSAFGLLSSASDVYSEPRCYGSYFTSKHNGVKKYYRMGVASNPFRIVIYEITQSESQSLIAYNPPTPPCSETNIASGGNCYCEVKNDLTPGTLTGSYNDFLYLGTGANSQGFALDYKAGGSLISGSFGDWSVVLQKKESFYKPNKILYSLSDENLVYPSDILTVQDTGVPASMGSEKVYTPQEGKTASIYLDTRLRDGFFDKNIDSLIDYSAQENPLDGLRFVRSSEQVQSTKFKLYYQTITSSSWIYHGEHSLDTAIFFPAGEKVYRARIDFSSPLYLQNIQRLKQDYTKNETRVCKTITQTRKEELLSGSGGEFASTYLSSIPFCGSLNVDIPLIGGALRSLCGYFEPIVKPVVAKFQPLIQFVSILPPSTPPTSFGFFPKVDQDGTNWKLTTQTGSAILYSTGSDIGLLKITNDEQSSGFKQSMIGIFAILIYLIVYIFHFGILVLIGWALLHFNSFIHKFIPPSHTGNAFSSVTFLVYLSTFTGFFLSFLLFFSFLLPILNIIKEFALFLIVTITSFAPGSYDLFTGFYTLFFAALVILPLVYMLHLIFERHARFN